MGPAFETFIQAILIAALVITPLIFLIRKPVRRLYTRLCEEDKKELLELRAREIECLEEEEARKKALAEVERDCFQTVSKDDLEARSKEASKTDAAVTETMER